MHLVCARVSGINPGVRLATNPWRNLNDRVDSSTQNGHNGVLWWWGRVGWGSGADGGGRGERGREEEGNETGLEMKEREEER